MTHRRQALILIAILLLAAGVRIYRLDEQSFWTDEFWSALLPAGRGYVQHQLPRNVLLPEAPDLFDLDSARPLHAVWFSEFKGNAPPLYPLIMRLWGEAFGLGQTSARAFSVLVSIAAIWLFFLAVRELSGPRIALWAALLMALAGPQVQYAQEARHYALLVLVGVGAAAALVRIEKRGPSRLRELGLIACVLAMTVTHYFAVGTILAMVVYAVLRLRGRTLAHVAGCFALAAALWAVVGAPVALRQFENINDPRQTDWLREDAPDRAVATLERLGLIPARYFTEPLLRSRAIAAVAGGVALLLAPLLAYRRRDLALWALWLWLTILPLLALDVLRETKHLNYMRYVLLGAPAMYALIAGVLPADRRGWIVHLAPAAAAFGCLVSLPAAYEGWWKADWRQLAEEIDRHRRPGQLVIFWRQQSDIPYTDDPAELFLFTSYYRHKPLGPTILMDQPPPAELAKEIARSGDALVVAVEHHSVTAAVPPGAHLRRLAFEPGAAALWLAEWPAPPGASTPTTSSR